MPVTKFSRRFLTILWRLADLTGFPVMLLAGLFAPFFRRAEAPWVIGGHRGRLYDDNAAVLHEYITGQTKQPVIWIANESIVTTLRARGIRAERRLGWRARLAILRAPVLITSHGDDDLDPALFAIRGRLGFRIYISHSMNFLKAGECYRPIYTRLGRVRRALYRMTITDFDALLAISELERRNFALSYPHRVERLCLGGGPHVDRILDGRSAPADHSIFWFPTFRDQERERNSLRKMILRIVSDARLIEALLTAGRTLRIGSHINDPRRPVELEPPMAWIPPERTREALFACEILVSDYSGLIFDALGLEKRIVLFPFDLEDYLGSRRFYTDYETLDFAERATSPEALVDLLIRDSPMTTERARRRDAWRSQVFPTLDPIYSRTTYETILRILPKGVVRE